MSLTVQNLRAVGAGVEPNSLLPGQIAFNVTDKILYVGDESAFKTNFDGSQVAGTPGAGWYSMPMDFDSLGEYYVANPSYYGDIPTDQQVLTWSDALNHPIWTSNVAGDNQVYVITNNDVAIAPGATTSAKITAAIGVVSPDEGDVTIVTGLPDDVYEGLYFFTTEWVKGAAYAYPSASEVIYNNTAHPSLTATVQGAIDDLDDGLIATTAIANTANSTANSALSIASAALPRAGGTMTGPLTLDSTLVDGAGSPGAINQVLVSTVTGVQWVSNAPGDVTGVTGTAPITVDNTDPQNPVVGVSDATTSSTGVVQVGTNIDVASGVISVKTADASNLGLVEVGTNIDVASGVISVKTADTANLGLVEVGTNIDVASGVISVKTATNTDLGLVQSGANIQNTAGVISILNANTTQSGVVQLNDTTISTSTTEAATANAVRVTKDVADAAVPRSSYAAGGDILVGTGAGTFGALGVGNQGQILVVGPGNTVQWEDDAPGDVTGVTGTAPITVNNADPENPVVGVDLATTATPGVVQIELTGNINIVGGVINVPDGSTTVKGAVQLNNTVSSTSTTLALTAAQGKALQDQIDSLTFANSVTLAGGYNAITGLVDGATSQGIGAGFLDGNPPPTPGAGNLDYYLICTTAGPLPSAMQNGDWLLSDGTQYVVLGVGARPASASYTTAGIVQLADAAAVLAGTSDTLAITPQALQDNVLDSVTTVNSSQIASSTAAKTAYDAGVQGQTDAAAAQVTANAALPKAGGTMTGTITTQNVNVQSTYSLQFAGGVNGSLDAVTDLTNVTSSTTAASATAVKSAYDAGIQGQTDAAAAQATANAALPLAGGTMTGNITFQDAGEGVVFNGGSLIRGISDATGNTNSDIAASSTAVKDAYALADAAVPRACYTALGALAAGTGTSTVGTLALGTNGQFLSVNSSCSTGVQWCTISLACIPCSAFTASGQLLAGTGTSTFTALNVGSNNQILVADSACTGGIKWLTSQGAFLCGYSCTLTPFNTAVGGFAGDSITTGTCNTVFGYNAGTALTGGLNNTFIGFSAGDGYTSADNSTAVGSNALGNTGGNNNTAVGFCAGGGMTSGGNNTMVGTCAGRNATSADNIAVLGFNALSGTHTGNGTVALGACALAVSTSGGCNTAVGCNAGLTVTTGALNTLVGFSAGSAITTGGQNTLVGRYTGTTTLANNVILSDGAGTIRFQANSSGAWSYDGTNFGTAGQVLASNGTAATPTWCTLSLACVPCSAFTASGELLAGTGAGTFTALTVGSNGQFLVADATCTGGLKWATECFVNDSSFTGTGAILAGTGVGSFSALPIGTNGQVLVPNSSCTTGLEWITTGALCLQGYTCAATPFNTVLGSTAGAALSALSVANTAIGFAALKAETSGDFNVALGHNALTAQNGASGNVAIGGNAGAQVTNGGNNILIGCNAGDVITTGSDNIAIGGNAGGATTNGTQSVFIGSNAGLVANTTGVTAIGFCAAQATTTSGCTTYVGWVSGRNATGLSNTYVGALTGCAASNTSACGTLLGFCAGSALTTGNGNNFIGFQAGRNVNTGGFNVAIGTAAFQTATSAANNVAIGCGALAGLSTTAGNTALGHRAMLNASTAANNVAIGCSAGEQISTGSTNVFIGNTAGDAVTTGSSNTIIGDVAGSTALANNLILAAGTTIKLQVNENGAVGVGTTPGYGTAGQVLKSAGTGAAPAWSSALYGAFSDSTIQTNTGGASGNPVDLNTTASSNGFSIVSGSQITATTAGVYNIQISLQFEKTDGGTDAVEVWFKKNGTDIASSNTNIQLQGGGAKQLFALNLVEPLTAGQYLEVWWYSADVNVRLAAVAAGTRPAIPSAIVTIVPVGA